MYKVDRFWYSKNTDNAKLLHRVVDRLKRKVFFKKMNRAYRHMKESPKIWRAELTERKLLDHAVADGLKE